MKWKGIMLSKDNGTPDESAYKEVSDEYNSNLTPDDKHPPTNIDFGLNACQVCSPQLFYNILSFKNVQFSSNEY